MRSCNWTRIALLIFTIVPWASSALAEDANPTIDLGIFDFTVERWSYDQEMVLRLVRDSYEVPYSDDPADIDKWRCWIETRRISKRIGYLFCARMGDITAARPKEHWFYGDEHQQAGYGKFLRSTHTVNRGKFKMIMNELTGNDQFNEEFVNLVTAGNRPPRYFPNYKEIDQFLAISEMLETVRTDASQIEVNELMQARGMSRARYNEIAKMIGLFPSVSAAVASRSSDQGYRYHPVIDNQQYWAFTEAPDNF